MPDKDDTTDTDDTAKPESTTEQKADAKKTKTVKKLVIISFILGLNSMQPNGWAMVSLWNCPLGPFRRYQAMI